MKKNNRLIFIIGIISIILSCILYAIAIIVPFLSLSWEVKKYLIPVTFVLSSITWYGGLAIIGKKFIYKYKHYFNPKNWKKISNAD